MNDLTVLPTPAPLSVESGLTLLPKSVARELAALPERGDVIRECRAILAAEAPANVEAFGVILEKFGLHYPESRLEAPEHRLVMQDWRRLLGHLPPDILQAACDAYLMSPARFFPTPGQLNALAEKLWAYRRMLASRARQTLDLIQQQTAH